MAIRPTMFRIYTDDNDRTAVRIDWETVEGLAATAPHPIGSPLDGLAVALALIAARDGTYREWL